MEKVVVFIFLLPLCSTFISLILYKILTKQGLLAQPIERSLHTIPKPYCGGIAFITTWLGFITILLLLKKIEIHHILFFLPSIVLIITIGLLDDLFDLSARYRFFLHVLASIFCIYLLGGFQQLNLGMIELPLSFLGIILFVFVTVWSTNLYNFMDGADGFAGVEGMFIYGVGGYFFWQAGGYELAILSWGLAVSLIGFLFFNWPPSKMFMGDVGSSFLGFLITPFAIAGELWYNIPALLWFILYGVFCFDATFTLVRRILNKEEWYRGHCSHAYQRLIRKFGSHKKILYGLIGCNIVLSAIAMTVNSNRQMLPWGLFVSFLILFILYRRVEFISPMYTHIKEESGISDA